MLLVVGYTTDRWSFFVTQTSYCELHFVLHSLMIMTYYEHNICLFVFIFHWNLMWMIISRISELFVLSFYLFSSSSGYCYSCNLTQPQTHNLMPELVVQLFVREFASHTSIDFCVLSHRIMLLRNNTLRIVNSSRADEGSYVCRAENQLGSAEMTAILWVKGKWCPGGLYFLPN